MASTPQFDRWQFDGHRRPFGRTDAEASILAEFRNESVKTFTHRGGRSPSYVPEFSRDDLQLRTAIIHLAIRYIFRGKQVLGDLQTDLLHLDALAKERTAHDSSFFDGEKLVWQRLAPYFQTVETAGGYLAMISAVAYRAWRLRWHNRDIAWSLATNCRTVSHILVKLKQEATKLGFDVPPPRKCGRYRLPKLYVRPSFEELTGISQREILSLWADGKTTNDIAKQVGVQRASVVKVLKAHDVYVRFRPLKHELDKRRQMIELWQQGLGTTKIAKRLNTSPGQVVVALKQAGLYERTYRRVTQCLPA